ncbi:restriction endonuclease subunit S [Levilactobacillus brevis]|uniref:restriction endonuclease subunit S n=1 Tax=Levilactobacillus brevis TaxID=1580 RepID=UPI003F4A82A4
MCPKIRIKFAIYHKTRILIPNISEQEKIGDFFEQLDNIITLHQRKLEKLQELKKGYLQKMFC